MYENGATLTRESLKTTPFDENFKLKKCKPNIHECLVSSEYFDSINTCRELFESSNATVQKKKEMPNSRDASPEKLHKPKEEMTTIKSNSANTQPKTTIVMKRPFTTSPKKTIDAETLKKLKKF